jgi:hypothetical protein
VNDAETAGWSPSLLGNPPYVPIVECGVRRGSVETCGIPKITLSTQIALIAKLSSSPVLPKQNAIISYLLFDMYSVERI